MQKAALSVLLTLLFACVSCTSVTKQNGVFRARGIGFKFLTFAIPRTDLETVKDAVIRNVGADAKITNVWQTSFFQPAYNFLYPVLGFEVVDIYGTY